MLEDFALFLQSMGSVARTLAAGILLLLVATASVAASFSTCMFFLSRRHARKTRSRLRASVVSIDESARKVKGA